MRALTRTRDENGAFPFVDGLIALAADVRAVLGPSVKISYAADWTEYGAYVPVDASNDVLFPLDALWADDHVDFVGVDWYPPTGDWRGGEDYLDAQAGFTAADDPAYLASQMAGGEAYDFFYASQADRDAQIRSPIVDTAHAEHFVFRQKDLAGWWSNPHHERPGGVRNGASTAWVPGSKPVRLSEIGFGAVDKGGNAPNLFFDPGSSESALPPYSTGARDDVFQRRALEAALGYWSGQSFVEASYVWAWDARPYPDFPLRETVWTDGPNWQVGHWLNGRTGLSFLSDIIADIAARTGVELDVSGVAGLVEGYALSGVSSLRGELEALVLAYDLEAVEMDGALALRNRANGAAAPIALSADELGEGGLQRTRTLLDKPPGRLRLTYIDAAGGYRPRVTEARNDTGDRGVVVDISIPLVLSETRADKLAERLLAARVARDSAELSLPMSALGIGAGDLLQIDGEGPLWRVTDIADRASRALSLEAFASPLTPPRSGKAGEAGAVARLSAEPSMVLIDGPAVGDGGMGPLVAASARPWPGVVRILAGPDEGALTERTVLDAPVGLGEVVSPLTGGPIGRYDRAAELFVRMPRQLLSSAGELMVLGGENRLLVGDADGWELIGFRETELVGEDTYRLTGLLRGLAGSTPRMNLTAGAFCVLADGRLSSVALGPDETDLDLVWRVETLSGQGGTQGFRHTDRAGLGWRPAHLRASPLSNGGWALSWVRRGADILDNWERPEAENAGNFHVAGYLGDDLVLEMDVAEPRAEVTASVDRIEVAERGTDGRLGAWAVLRL